MGFFDPGWRKALAKSPRWFERAALAWDAELTASLTGLGVPGSGFDLCRSVVDGSVALHLAGLVPDWSSEATAFINMDAKNAFRVLPRRYDLNLPLHALTVALVPRALAEVAYRGGGPSFDLPVEPSSTDAPFRLPRADDVAAAVAVAAMSMTSGHLRVERVDQEASGEGWMFWLRVHDSHSDIAVQTLCFQLEQSHRATGSSIISRCLRRR